jgi:hypothetical protein
MPSNLDGSRGREGRPVLAVVFHGCASSSKAWAIRA